MFPRRHRRGKRAIALVPLREARWPRSRHAPCRTTMAADSRRCVVVREAGFMSARIALVSEHASPLATLGGVDSGGQNVYVAQTARHLAAMGFHVDVFHLRIAVKVQRRRRSRLHNRLKAMQRTASALLRARRTRESHLRRGKPRRYAFERSATLTTTNRFSHLLSLSSFIRLWAERPGADIRFTPIGTESTNSCQHGQR